ncbi:hypothetical protein CHLNCDRAFT_138126 [Chlorella variabilis]|uniref:Uncharacterized protein n=1 Tax=Chlorella variabilis TaxID=554065 RepID=E1Z5B6_CHLVA|nr:hypothetical protein CHLNCDRAFT_138126 [Chlorella variabilis]EFN59497.1 hypothetical protein CHLNCDRAFT_138126 [Chlorella variabilis]|eukprot:XP_005851599.1 hypothetical protein CHLNCDRAFT_138126 [Chlorella variabilis]
MGGSKRGKRPSRSDNSSKSSNTVLTPVEQQQEQQQQQQQAHQGAHKAASARDAQQARQRAAAANGAASSSSSAAAGTAAAPDAGRLLPIAFADGQVTVGDGLVLLDRITPLARVQHPASTDMVLLSLAASQGATAIEDFSLGVLHCKQWLCCARNKLWWMTPEWGKNARDLPPETQFLLAELEDGTYAAILPLISQQKFRGTLRPPR